MATWTLVTGGAKGLGAQTCMSLAKRGHNIVVHYLHSAEEAGQVAESCRSLGVNADCFQGDLSLIDPFVQSYIERFEDTGYLVNNVGNFSLGTISEATSDEWQQLFQSNVFAPMLLTKGLLSSLKQHKGAVVNIGLAGIERFYADTYCAAYSAAKAALFQASRSLARELVPHQVRVNMVSPGYLESSVVKPSQVMQLERLASLHEVAEAVAYFLSDDAKYITGQNLEVAGGVRL
ncbi:MAG: SDR family oxidoreductase [Chlamydiales bacterium]|nr:SDR family oxidoreductase [Chlamydiales bacterium]